MLPYALALWCQYIIQFISIQFMFMDVPSQQTRWPVTATAQQTNTNNKEQ